MVFQQFNLFPHLTVLKNGTNLGTMPKQKAEEVAMQLLERVGILEQALKYRSAFRWSAAAGSDRPPCM